MIGTAFSPDLPTQRNGTGLRGASQDQGNCAGPRGTSRAQRGQTGSGERRRAQSRDTPAVEASFVWADIVDDDI